MAGVTAEAPPRRVPRYQLDTTPGRLTPEASAAKGKAARTAAPRFSHAAFDPGTDRPDPIALLEEQAKTRVPELVPVRWGYGELCGWTLARAHARSGDRIAIASYLGNSDVFDKAVAAFAVAYADQNERDYQALKDAAAAGRITAEQGL
jgi:hypothetical protein